MSNSLLSVKFFIPHPRPDLVERLSLLIRFEAGLQRPLTLISAPAGFGKSTLVSAWIERRRGFPPAEPAYRVAWLSLDPNDNDPLRFWLYGLSALQNSAAARPGDGPQPADFNELIQVIQVDAPPPVQSLLDGVINQLARSAQDWLLVLDDYHLIQSAQVHEQMAYLLEHLPPNLRLVIVTRADPPLPLTRLRARGQLSEFRAADLRFSGVETEQFLQAALGLAIQPEDRLALEKSTEGWIAGLQMAALALQAPFAGERDEGETRAYVHDFITSFSGKHVYILDYLADEVFNSQPGDVQSFLLKTSVLEKMSAGLCDELLGEDAPHAHPPARTSRAILEYLERSNLFLIPLDHERQWFRYHHLFGDLLRARLDETWPGLRPRLLIRASQWFERSAGMEDAINYALAAEDWERAAALMESHIQSFLELGQLSKIMDWIGRLPVPVAACRAGLIIQQAWVMGLAQRKDAFFSLLDAAEGLLGSQAEEGGSDLPAENRRLWVNLIILRGYQAVMESDPRRGLELLRGPFLAYPTGGLWEDCWMHWVRGFTHRMAGDLAAAIADFQCALDLSRGRLWVDMVCCTDLGMVYHLQGRLQKAREIYLQGLALAKTHTSANHGYLNRLVSGFSAVLLDLNELEEAARYNALGLEWMKWWPSANTRVRVFTVQGRVRLAQGDLPAAAELIAQAQEERRSWPLIPINDSLVDDAQVRLWLAQNDLPAARQWAQALERQYGPQPASEGGIDESLEMRWMALARVRLAEGRAGSLAALDKAMDICACLEAPARAAGRVRAH